MLTIRYVMFDAPDALALGRFWAEALGWDLHPDSTVELASVGQESRPAGAPTVLCQRVPEPKTAKNRCHVDVSATDRATEVGRLVGLGAEVVDEHEGWGHRWTVMRDPAGNEFCVVQAPPS